ncbi:MAG: hypothetical protein ACKO51_01385 [Alphaproteobacteria bacterium]
MVRRMSTMIFPAPAPAAWPATNPTEAGFDAGKMQSAVDFSAAHETPWPYDLAGHIGRGFFEAPPHNEVLGPLSPRGATGGLITRQGVSCAAAKATAPCSFAASKPASLGVVAGQAAGAGAGKIMVLMRLTMRLSVSLSKRGRAGPWRAEAAWWVSLAEEEARWTAPQKPMPAIWM